MRSQTALRRSERLTPSLYRQTAVNSAILFTAPELLRENDLDETDPFVYNKSVKNDPDTLYWNEAMASPHKRKFLAAMEDEVNSLVNKGTWSEELTQRIAEIVTPNQWVFRIKRTSDGDFKKFKARICLRGDLQEDDGTSNYSPVVAWSTVRSFLVISHIRNWVTSSISPPTTRFVSTNLETSMQSKL